MLIITIKQGKEQSLLNGDPWIYLSAIEKVEGKPQERNKLGATAVVDPRRTLPGACGLQRQVANRSPRLDPA